MPMSGVEDLICNFPEVKLVVADTVEDGLILKVSDPPPHQVSAEGGKFSRDVRHFYSYKGR